MAVLFSCCKHCDGSGFHPFGRNEHPAPCPQGCND